VRDVIAKTRAGAREPAPAAAIRAVRHSSHAQFELAPIGADGRCVIEPAVACNHCGYCKSYGH
jgi:hypothetical protein